MEHRTERQQAKITACLNAGDPRAEGQLGLAVLPAAPLDYHATTAKGRQIAETVLNSFHTCPIPEVARLGSTLRAWKAQVLAYFDTSGVSNGGTEAINLIIEKLLALPAAFINERFGKAGLLTGLGLAAAGSFLFFPASRIMTFGAFLIALFAIAAGCSILETSANPYVLSLGPEETATRRLNFAQAFNPVGTNIGVLLAATLILPKLESPVDLASATPEQVHDIRAAQLAAVMGPYIGLGILLAVLGVVIATQRAPEIVEEFPDTGETGQGALFRMLWRNRRYRFGVVAQALAASTRSRRLRPGDSATTCSAGTRPLRPELRGDGSVRVV